MRKQLADLIHQTFIFTGRFETYSKTSDGANVACVSMISIDGHQVADHVWIHRSKHMKNLDLKRGDWLQFEARVGRYVKGSPKPHFEPLQYDYNLIKIRDLIILERVEESENVGD